MTNIPVRMAGSLALIGHIETHISREQAAHQGHIDIYVYSAMSSSYRPTTGSDPTTDAIPIVRLPVQDMLVYGDRWTTVVIDDPRRVFDLPGFTLAPEQCGLLCELTMQLLRDDRQFIMAMGYSGNPWTYLLRHEPGRGPEVLERWVYRLTHPHLVGVDRASGPDTTAMMAYRPPPTVALDRLGQHMARFAEREVAEMLQMRDGLRHVTAETPNRANKPEAALVTTTRVYTKTVRALDL